MFATGLTLAVMLVMFVMLIGDMTAHLPDFFDEWQFGLRHVMMFVGAAVVMFAVSSIIIDSVLNPIRQMISKINEIGQMKFKSPLVIDASDDELRDYAIAFNAMAENLNRHIKSQNQFVSDASHELATPITVINGHADMLLRRARDNPEILENGLTTIKSEIMRMSGLVDSLLLLAKSDGGRQSYNFEPVNMRILIEESVAEIKLIAPDFIFETDFVGLPGAKPLDLPQSLATAPVTPLATSLIIRCDEYAIRRVMRILLTNAVKYSTDSASDSTSGHSPPKVTIAASSSHGLLRVSVHDNGIGIPPAHISRIFERFYRVDSSRNKKTGSSGLGLAIAKEIITAHGGEISAASSPGHGAEIIFTISS